MGNRFIEWRRKGCLDFLTVETHAPVPKTFMSLLSPASKLESIVETLPGISLNVDKFYMFPGFPIRSIKYSLKHRFNFKSSMVKEVRRMKQSR
ncbi:hypothetical protein L2E82_36352 [Cichorium intybus]|uniref:Uncharacterized protein n=1 Tax=Cichorium intybus TaxID=13427 RepID=A0ACB9BRB6_CICIN|nr:hypothetical protein L2E82_36352 [Cichorium intybus]